MKTRHLTILLFALSQAHSAPDLTDRIQDSKHSISGRFSGYLSLSYDQPDRKYIATYFTSTISGRFETFWNRKWSWDITPGLSFRINNSFLSFDPYLSAAISRYFSVQPLIPYVRFGLSIQGILEDDYYNARISPDLVIGVVKEIKDRVYFDIGIVVPTFVGISVSTHSSEYPFISTAASFTVGMKYYY